MTTTREQREKLLLNAARDGDVGAQLQLARRYEARCDLTNAEHWYSKAATTGDLNAQYSLGHLYLKNFSDDFDRSDAGTSLITKAAASGHLAAILDLGKLYDSSGAYVEAARWWQRGADRGIPTAQMKLGNYYAQGIGVPQDYILAHMWLNIAASRMDTEYLNPERSTEREDCFKFRDSIAELMTKEQVVQAQQLARGWIPIDDG